MSNLGYQNHTMTCDQIPLTVVAKDSVRLANSNGVTHYLTGSSVEIGPGESRDVIFTAPLGLTDDDVPLLRPQLRLPQQRWRRGLPAGS